MLAVFFAILTFIGWGSGDIFGTVATRKIGAFKSSFWVWALSVVYMTAMAPLFFHQLAGVSPWLMLLMVGLGVEVMLSYLAFAEALRTGNPSIVGTVAGSFVGLVVILSLVFLGEKLDSRQIWAIVVIMAGLALTSMNFQQLRTRQFKYNRSVALAFLTMIGWAIYFTFLKIPVSQVGWFWPDYIATVAGTVFLLLFGLRRVALTKAQARAGFMPALGCAVISGGGALTYNVALAHGSSAVVAPIAGAYPVLFVILSSIVFKEPVTTSQKVGMGVTLAGIVWLSLATG